MTKAQMDGHAQSAWFFLLSADHVFAAIMNDTLLKYTRLSIQATVTKQKPLNSIRLCNRRHRILFGKGSPFGSQT